MKRFASVLVVFALLLSCNEPEEIAHDLVITNATILNTVTGKTETGKTIIIDSGIISDVIAAGTEVKADAVIDAQNRLVVPGFIDAVGHLDDVFGDRPDTLKTSVEDCTRQFASTYLPYGVTTVRSSGDGTGYYAIADYLFQHRRADVPDFYFSGGSLAGWYEGSPYINHLLVQDSSEAVYWVQSMLKTGSVHSIKLYCNGAMTYPIFTAALHRAMMMNVPVTAQVQNEITIDSALSLGLINFEHASTLCYQRNLFHFTNDVAFRDTLRAYWPSDDERGSRIYPFLEAANFSGADHPEITATIRNMAAHGATMTTSLHFFAQWLDKTWFCSQPKASRFVCDSFTVQQKERCLRGYAIMAGYVKQMFDEGVTLAIGTDHRDGGKAVLSEILLLHELGIPMENCLQIATLNSARAIGLQSVYGSIEKGKRANLIVFSANPIDESRNLLADKLIVKDGVILPQ